MYRKIEEIYKKESPYNIIKRRTLILYIIVVIFLFLLNVKSYIILMIILVLCSIVLMKIISENVLKEKLHIKFRKSKNYGKPLNKIIAEKENQMFKSYLIENQMFDKEIILCILNHYRNEMKTKLISGNFLTIVSIVISILAIFITKDGFDINNFENVLPVIIGIITIMITIYYTFKAIGEFKIFIKGEDGMIERLETIFSELYVEYISNEDKSKLQKISKKNKIK